MPGPLTAFARWRALKKRRSLAPTAITPLQAVRSVTVFMDGSGQSVTSDIAFIRNSFSEYGIAVHIFAFNLGKTRFVNEGQFTDSFIHKENINVFGWIKTNSRTPVVDGEEELFISLFSPEPYAVEFAARCSRAVFKVGRNQLKGNVYDLVLSEPEGTVASQMESFSAIFELLKKVK